MDETAATPNDPGAGWTDVFGASLFGIELGGALLALAILAGAFALRPWIGDILRYGLERVTSRTRNGIDDEVVDAVTEPASYLPIALGVFLAVEALGLTGIAAAIGESLAQTILAGAVFWALLRLVPTFSKALHRRETPLTASMVAWTVKAMRILIWSVGLATILELWGVRVLPIIAGLGLIGVAVALGAQDLFKNLISGVLILSERRFCVGDWIKVDGVVEGTVMEINFRSTKVRRFDRAPVYVPNTAFADGAVVNFGEMTHRRISWAIGLEYRATAEQLQTIRDRIEAAILEDARFLPPSEAPCFVRLDGFAASSVDLMIYVFTQTRDWGEWLRIKEELLLTIKRIVEEEGAGFAFPSSSIYLEPGGAFERPVQVALQAQNAPAAPAQKAAPAAKAPAKAAPAKSAPAKASSSRTGRGKADAPPKKARAAAPAAKESKAPSAAPTSAGAAPDKAPRAAAE